MYPGAHNAAPPQMYSVPPHQVQQQVQQPPIQYSGQGNAGYNDRTCDEGKTISWGKTNTSTNPPDHRNDQGWTSHTHSTISHPNQHSGWGPSKPRGWMA